MSSQQTDNAAMPQSKPSLTSMPNDEIKNEERKSVNTKKEHTVILD